MSWWDSSSLTSFASQATQALKTAQKKIDKVLDIKEEEELAGDAPVLPPSSPSDESLLSPTETTPADGDNTWNAYLGDAALSPASRPKTPPKKTGSLKRKSGLGMRLSPSVSAGNLGAGAATDTDEASSRNTAIEPTEAKKVDDTAVFRPVTPVTPPTEQTTWNIATLVSPSSPTDGETADDESQSTPPKLGSRIGKRSSPREKKLREGSNSKQPQDTESDTITEQDKLVAPEDVAQQVPETQLQAETTETVVPSPPDVQIIESSPDDSRPVAKPEQASRIPTLQLTDSAVLDAKESDWSDLSLSLLSESQMSTASTASKAGSTDSHVLVEKSDLFESKTEELETVEDRTDCDSAKASIVETETEAETRVKLEQECTETPDTADRLSAEAQVSETETSDTTTVSIEHTTTVSIARTDTSDSLCSSQAPDTERMDLSSEMTDDSNKTLTADEFEAALSSSRESQSAATTETEQTEEKSSKDAEAADTAAAADDEVDNKKEEEERHASSLSSSSPDSKKEQGTLSSSSYVKNMLEEAMVESLKDTDSHADSQSHSSSEMVRIESGQNSGHTSADEIETTTSSDIEIISHMSTPTPNGEYGMVMRPLDLSPLRHAFGKPHRRYSPPEGHKRTDSGSSGYSLQSRNGDDVLSPDGSNRQGDGEAGATASGSGHRSSRGARGHGNRSEVAEPGGDSENNPYDPDKLLKAESGSSSTHSPTPLQSISENVAQEDSAKEELTPADVTETPDKKLAEMAEVLEARERKLLQYSKENVDLVEANNIIRNQLQQSEEAREAEMADLDELTEEFTKRLTDAEKRLQTVLREKEMLKKRSNYAESELAKKSSNSVSIEKMLKEKDLQISELLEEGEKLSKQQLQSNNIIKKLRVKEKENDSLIKTQKQKVDDQKSEIDRLEKILDAKMEVEKKQIDAINQLNNAVKKQELEIGRLKSDLEDAEEKLRSMQLALDNSYKEIADLHKQQVAKVSQAQEVALSSEVQAKEELRLALERQQVQTRQEQEMLVIQIEDLQLSMTRMEKEYGRREDMLRQEISDTQQRMQEGEDRNQELTQHVTAATRPLLRQIENLQATYAAQANSFDKVERNLTERLAEAQSQLAAATEKERMASEQLLELTSRLSSLESQVSGLRQEKSRLQAHLEMERAKADLLEESKHNETAKFDMQLSSMTREVSELKRDKVLLDNQLEMEKMKVEAEKKKLVLAHEQLREKELQAFTRASSTPPRPLSREGNASVSSENLMSISQQEELLQRSLMISSTNGNKTNLYDSLRQSGASSLVENLHSQLKMREGEILQLQSEIQELERTRESMARELVNLSNQVEELEQKLIDSSVYQRKFTDLDQRYNALLQMYGEKVEQSQELELDLQDVKEMYKSQIDELLGTK